MTEPVDYTTGHGDPNNNQQNGDHVVHWADSEELLGRVTGELPSWEGSVVESRPKPPRPASERPNYAGAGPASPAPAEPAAAPPPQRPDIGLPPAAQPVLQQPEFDSQQIAPVETPQPRPTRQQERSSSRLGWITAGILACLLALAGGYLFFVAGDGDDSTAQSSDQQGAISAESIDSPVEEITLLLQGIGYEGVDVELRDSTLFLTGEIESQADRAAVVTASTSLAEGLPINTDGLIVAPAGATTDPDDQSANDQAAALPMATNPLRLLQVSLDRTSATAPIIFEPTITEISEWHTPTLDKIADTLLANPGIAVAIVGYTDGSGLAEINASLSFQRAESVQEYLIGRGVPAGLLSIDPRGESEASGLRDISYLERRVEFDVIAIEQLPPLALAPLEVGVIVPSPSDDLAFSQAMVQALEQVNATRGSLSITVNDNMFDVEAATELARQQAAGGFDVVILHGAQFRDVAESLAAEYPDVVFVTGPVEDDAQLPANVFAYSVAAEQGAFVLGHLAAQISDSATIGIVGPVEASEPKRYIGGFTAGAESHGATVLSEYIGSFNDTEAATAVSLAQLQAGADVLTGTAQMVTGPVALAAEQGVPWFANQANQTELAPANVVASQVYHFEVALEPIFAEIDAGATTGGTFPLTLGNGGVLLEFNDAYPLSQELRLEADQNLLAVAAGSITINY